MKITAMTLTVVLAFAANVTAEEKGEKKVGPALNFKMKGIDGKSVDLSQFQGKVVLFVNVASECGLTPQYAGLQKLHDKYGREGLVIIGVPANEFGSQEPGTDTEIEKFCSTKYGVKFTMLSKVVVKGEGITPLYDFLTGKDAKFPGAITWNFEKFLVGRNGEVVSRFKPTVKPDDPAFVKAIETEMEKK